LKEFPDNVTLSTMKQRLIFSATNIPFLILIFLLLSCIFSCNLGIPDGGNGAGMDDEFTSNENFDLEDMPDFELVEPDGYYLCKPWNYDKAWNEHRNYPLLVWMHGSGGASEPTYLAQLGYGSSETAVAFKSSHPCFVYAPQTSGSWDNNRLVAELEAIREQYRIDYTRIYSVGYSMGGYNSILLANAYYDYNGSAFASIMPIAGTTTSQLREDLRSMTSAWFQIGMQDNPSWVANLQQAYENLKTALPEAIETTSEISIENHPGTTWTLTLNGKAIVRKSEYSDDGHGIWLTPLRDPATIEWIFGQDLDHRE
jgi:predicted peptidase